MKLEFTKMEGLGNDYIYVDAARFPIADPAALSVRLSDRHFSVGGDGLVMIGPSDCADFSMRMFNADGSEGMMCGNAARCIGKYVYEKGLTASREISLETRSGIKKLSLHLGADGKVESVTVGMGGFVIERRNLELEAAGSVFRGTVVNVGNPHFVVFCEDAEAVDLPTVGPVIERHPLFPDRINVEFASVMPGRPSVIHGRPSVMPGRPSVMPGLTGHLRMRVWERGSGITMACGTGACATAAAAVTAGLVSSPCTLVMDGGELQVACQDGTLQMTGPARISFEGVVEYSPSLANVQRC